MTETCIVVDVYGREARVSTADLNDPHRVILPFYTRRGIKWTHTKTGLRAAAHGKCFGIRRENILAATPKENRS